MRCFHRVDCKFPLVPPSEPCLVICILCKSYAFLNEPLCVNMAASPIFCYSTYYDIISIYTMFYCCSDLDTSGYKDICFKFFGVKEHMLNLTIIILNTKYKHG